MLRLIFARYIINPLRFSLSGFRSALHDRAFRFEIILGILFLPGLVYYFWPSFSACILTSVGYIGILVTECMNCAIETVVDLASPQLHPLAKKAKDIASCAVLLSLLNFVLLLAYSFYVA